LWSLESVAAVAALRAVWIDERTFWTLHILAVLASEAVSRPRKSLKKAEPQKTSIPLNPAAWPLTGSRSVDNCTEIMYDKDMPLCAVYARVSTEFQSCQLQLTELREYAERRGWQVAGEFVDEGVSGRKASRPALDKLMASARLRRFDAVLVWKLDRWGRSVVDSIRSIQELVSLGIRFIAVTQNIDTDESNPMSRFFLHVMSAFAEMEVSLIRERTIAGVRAARANGKTLGRPKRVFRRDEVVRLRDDRGFSWRAIAKELKIPVMTAVDAYRTCTEIATPEPSVAPAKTKRKKTAA